MGNKTKKILNYLMYFPSATTRNVAKEVGVSTRMVRYVKESKRIQTDGNKVKILFVDVETSPMEVYVWGLYKQQIPISNVIKDWSLLSWSAKWLHDDKIMSKKVSTIEAMGRTDFSVIESLWKLFNEADIIVAHNAIKFDVRKINARFIENGYAPPSPYQVIDTLKVAQRYFGFSSHKLEYLMGLLGSENKKHTSFSLWKRCVNGDEDALKYMLEYNEQDVVVLEELYLILRPWIKSHVNLGLYTENTDSVCANCGSNKLDWNTKYYTPANKYSAYRCLNCGAFGRSRFSKITKDKRKNLTISIAR